MSPGLWQYPIRSNLLAAKPPRILRPELLTEQRRFCSSKYRCLRLWFGQDQVVGDVVFSSQTRMLRGLCGQFVVARKP